MKTSPHPQGSAEWLLSRCGIATASELDNLVTPLFKVRQGEMPRTYLATKLAEKWLRGPLAGFNGFDVEQGKILEEEARPWLALELDTEVATTGFITTDDGTAGCSPDGIIGGNVGVEIKCPNPTTHCKYLLNGTVPPEYLAQIHGGMYVTGFSEWRFLSYRRGFPPLMVTVTRDAEIQAVIHEAIMEFNSALATAYARMVEINCGEPK